MENDEKLTEAYKTIGEVTEDLGLIDKKTGEKQTHTLRYWESQFKQIKPIVRAGNRRYYSEKNLKIIKSIKILLKQQGLTVYGVKKILNEDGIDSLDPNADLGVYKPALKTVVGIKNRLKKISKIINEIKELK